MKKTLPVLLMLVSFLAGCYHEAYYVSPFDANNSTYHTIPLRSDSVKSGWFASSAFAFGSANAGDGLISVNSDGVFNFHTNIYRTHNLGFLEVYYGIDISLGNYSVSKYDSTGNSSTVNYHDINNNSGNKFFGGVGYNGGFAFAIPLGRSEWRIGADASFQNEFGSYLNFRKQLPDSAATFIIRNPSFITLSWWTELAFKTKNGSWGFKLMNGKVLGNPYSQVNQFFNDESYSYNNSSFVFQVTNKKYTGYLMESASPLAFMVQLGLNYRIALKKTNTLKIY